MPLQARNQSSGRYLLILSATALVALPAYACFSCSGASICTLPGLAIFGEHVAPVLPILAAFIERPFLTRMGITERTTSISIAANCNAAVVATISLIPGFILGPLVIVVAFLVTAATKWLLLRHLTTTPNRCFAGFLGASFVSALVIATLPVWSGILGTDRPLYWIPIRKHVDLIAPVTLLFCGIVILISFIRAWPVYNRPRTSVEFQPGFEVIVK